jgi:hypothetical protein
VNFCKWAYEFRMHAALAVSLCETLKRSVSQTSRLADLPPPGFFGYAYPLGTHSCSVVPRADKLTGAVGPGSTDGWWLRTVPAAGSQLVGVTRRPTLASRSE